MAVTTTSCWTFLLFLWIVSTAADDTTITAGSNNVTLLQRSLVVAHDVPAGFSIDRWSSCQQPDGGAVEYKLLDSPHSDRFALVGNGLLMTTARLDGLLHHPQPLTLYLTEDGPLRKSTHAVQLYVVDRKRLIHFPKSLYRARLMENAPSGTMVQLDGLEVNVNNGSNVHFDLIGGAGSFRIHHEPGTTKAQLITMKPLDREHQPVYDLILRAKSSHPPGTTSCRILITVEDENDNRPTFKHPEFHFNLPSGAQKYDRLGQVKAVDADGDEIVYRLTSPSNLFVMIPQTGELILVSDEKLPANRSFELEVSARDKRGLEATETAHIFVSSFVEDEEPEDHHNIVKRRAPRALRPTKRIEFSEADGAPEGKLMFPLDKPSEKERFKIRDDNPWVTVEPNGNVRVKRKWDYEELGPEKTIDFWVSISNSEGGGGKTKLFFSELLPSGGGFTIHYRWFNGFQENVIIFMVNRRQ